MTDSPKKRPDAEHAYYYNTKTQTVEYGMWSAFTYRLGPYPTRKAAEHAHEIAAARNEQWIKESREWNEDLETEDDDPGT